MINLIAENIDVWTSAQIQKSNGVGRSNSSLNQIYGIKKLRELILELAVRGKLVPQDPNEEPASTLLEKIAKEKARLIKAGKIRKQEPLPEISEDDKPFELPVGWKWTRLGNLSANIHYGYTASAIHGNSGIRLLRITDIQNDSVNWETVPGCDIEENQVGDYLLENGDILIARTGGTIGKSYLVENIEVKAVFASYLIRVKRIEGTYSPFIKTYMGSQLYWQQLYENSMGTGQPNVNATALKSLVFPIPSLVEQHRIVAKVNELMALCDQLEQQQTDSNAAHQTLLETLLATLTSAADQGEFIEAWQRIANHFDTLFTTEYSIDQLKQTILQLAVMGKLVPQDPNDEPASVLLAKIAKEKARFIKEGKIKKEKPLPEINEDEKPFQLPKNWEWSYLGQCFSLMSGTSFNKEKELESGQYIYVKVADMNLERNEVEITTSSRFLNPTTKELNALIPSGSIIFPKRGGAIATNKKRFVKNDLFVDLNVMAITPFEGINLDYAYGWLLGIDLAKLNSGTSVPQINNKDVAPLFFPIPPLNEQHRIVAKVDELMSLCDTLKTRLKDAQTTQVQLADAIVEKAVV
jgi:type I restriction enzyme, S subunit